MRETNLDEGSAFGRGKRIWTREAHLDEFSVRLGKRQIRKIPLGDGNEFGRGKLIWTREAHLDKGSAFGRGKRIRTSFQ